MLERVSKENPKHFIDFSAIKTYETGTGLCYVYNAVIKKTRQGKPFATLYLRDINGNSVPGYVFDLASELWAGGDAAKVMNSIVQIQWQENYLKGLGMTLILDKVGVALDASPEDFALFQGEIEDRAGKASTITAYVKRKLGLQITLPVTLNTYANPEYSNGKQGGLLEHFWKTALALDALQGLTKEEERRIAGIFSLYIFARTSYLAAVDNGDDSILLTSALTKRVSALAESMDLGPAALEVVHMHFGYEPKDLYVRTVVAVSDNIHRVDKEFAVYKTIPLSQEGDAGYGKIRRYVVEGS